MAESVQDLMGGKSQQPDTSSLTQIGDVYMYRLPDGSQIYFPKNHAEQGNWIPMRDYKQANEAAGMDVSEAQKFAESIKMSGMGNAAPMNKQNEGMASQLAQGAKDMGWFWGIVSQGSGQKKQKKPYEYGQVQPIKRSVLMGGLGSGDYEGNQ